MTRASKVWTCSTWLGSLTVTSKPRIMRVEPMASAIPAVAPCFEAAVTRTFMAVFLSRISTANGLIQETDHAVFPLGRGCCQTRGVRSARDVPDFDRTRGCGLEVGGGPDLISHGAG